MASSTLLCLELEHGLADNDELQQALDTSGNGFDADATQVDAATRVFDPVVVDDSAASFFGTSRLVIDEQIGIANSVTVELWAQYASPFGIDRLFDSSGRFYIGRNLDGQIECGINGGADDHRVDSRLVISDSNWHHFACVFDASTRDIKIYVDGSVDDCEQLDATIDTNRNAATTVGIGFVGLLDSVHVYASALSPAAVCVNAGRGTACSAQCPTGDGPGG
jgi:hypothetical protein